MSTNAFNKIYEIFKEKLSTHILNDEKLKEYITFCLSNNTEKAIKLTTSHHHILPRSKSLPFSEFSKLSESPWNGVHLTYYNHYYAHYLLQEAIIHPSILYAFTTMHHKDSKIGRIKEAELIDSDTFNQLMKIRNQNISKDKLTLVSYNGKNITKQKLISITTVIPQEVLKQRSVIMLGSNNIVNLEGVVNKIRQTKSETIIDGKNLDTISAERAAETMHKEFINQDGESTTIYKENGKKISQHYSTEIILEDGTITTLGKIRGDKHVAKLRAKSAIYIIKNIFDATYLQTLPAYELRKISPDLQSKTKDNYLGKSKFGQTYFKNTNREHLIGLYVEKLE